MATSKDKSEYLSESVRPKRQIQLPTYLSDYQLNVTGHRELTSSHVGNMAAETTFRSEGEGNTESDGTAKRRPAVDSASAKSESDEWGIFYIELEDIQAQLVQDTQLIWSLRD